MTPEQSAATLADLTDADLIAVARATPIHPDACRFIPTEWLRAAIAADRALNAPYIAALEADATKYRNIGAPIAPEHEEELQRLGDEAVRRHHDDMDCAARYRWLRHRTMGLRDNEGRQYFGFPSIFGLRPVTNIMKGSVSQHLDAAIDAARASAGGDNNG